MRYLITSIAAGILFGVLDGLLNMNPLAQKLLAFYKPISRPAVNAPLGMVIDLVFGFVLGAVFLLLYSSLPGQTGLLKGVSFGLLVWFFRVVMYAASSYIMFNISPQALAYVLISGLLEMLLLGLLYGFLLKSQ